MHASIIIVGNTTIKLATAPVGDCSTPCGEAPKPPTTMSGVCKGCSSQHNSNISICHVNNMAQNWAFLIYAKVGDVYMREIIVGNNLLAINGVSNLNGSRHCSGRSKTARGS